MGHQEIVQSIHNEYSVAIDKLLPYSFLSNNVVVSRTLLVGYS